MCTALTKIDVFEVEVNENVSISIHAIFVEKLIEKGV